MATNTSKIQASSSEAKSALNSGDWDWVHVVLGWALVITVARRLLVTKWTDDLYLVAYIANLAYLFGLALGYSRFKSRLVLFFATLYGAFFIGWQLGLQQGTNLLWSEKISVIFTRLFIIFQKISDRQPAYDNLLFLLLMMTLFWVLSLNTAYSIARSKQVWRTILPLFFVLILIQTYDPLIPSHNGYLYLFSVLSVFVIGRSFYVRQKGTWNKRHFYIPPQLSLEALQFTFVLVILLLFISFLLPASRSQLESMARAWENIKQPFESLQKDFENAFSSLRVTTITQPELYERTLNLGRGNELSEEEIFTAIAQAKLPNESRLFWRSRVYDRYENGQWSLSEVLTRDLDANAFDVDFPLFPNRPARYPSFTLYPSQPLKTLILPAQPHWTNLEVEIEYIQNPDGSEDLVAIRSQIPLPPGKTYTARASLSFVTEEQLRAASGEYPSWVTARYLQLPETLTERTKQLALEITQDLPTPYDKAVAITEYLRTHIAYVETLEEFPSNQDLIDWFLFDYQRGFCNYYATAATLMLRSLGIPSRLAVGFAEGTLEDIQAANVYIVRKRDAHAWVEVFFPNIGWIEFEPTSSQPPLSRPHTLDRDLSPAEISTQEIDPQEILKKLHAEKPEQEPPLSPSRQRSSFVFILMIFIIGLLSLIILTTFNRQKFDQAYQTLPVVLEKRIRALGLSPPRFLTDWSQLTQLTPIEKSYQRINTALKILGDPAPIYYTPAERALKLLTLLPEAESEVRQLVQLYHASLYGKADNLWIETKKLSRKVVQLALRKRLLNQLERLGIGKK